jgi:hypothetical protein
MRVHDKSNISFGSFPASTTNCNAACSSGLQAVKYTRILLNNWKQRINTISVIKESL